jgi:hypothetical protein
MWISCEKEFIFAIEWCMAPAIHHASDEASFSHLAMQEIIQWISN